LPSCRGEHGRGIWDALEKDVRLRGAQSILLDGVQLMSYSELVDTLLGAERVVNL